MENQALARLEALSGTGEPDASKGACPVREGAVGFPSSEGAGRLPHNSWENVSRDTRALFFSNTLLSLHL